jgi:signal peptidase II
VALPGAFLVGALVWAVRSRGLRPLAVAGVALVLGGGLSNGVDRLLHGSVVIDFMSVGIGPIRSGIFNLADLTLELGVLLLLFAHFRLPRRRATPPVPPNRD